MSCSYWSARIIPLCLLALCGAVLLGCAEEEAGAPADAQEEIEDPIPFRSDGTLHVLQENDTLRTLDIEIADTDSARARGLMERTSLPEDSGMLFIFEQEQPQSFWMANTPLALDIIFADREGEIVSMTKYTRPYSQEQVQSGVPAQHVLEVPAGYADQVGIIEGQRLVWTRHEADPEEE
ncbi:MAG: DUF192 domain-containing protein [Longimonas sp.]|uniref:DUF192 domain-containing protein n=1 Tax=Longimonas sp. TaxID=2039626 RepID=UPI00335A7AF3